LRQAIDEIVRRHEPLRTIYVASDGVPQQEILPSQPFALTLETVPGDAARADDLEQRILDYARRPFDLGRGPMLRAWLLNLGETRHVLVLTIHHIAFDGWSRSVFFRELTTLYEAYSAGVAAALPDVPMRYVEFAADQRARLCGERRATLMAYWKEQLRPPRPILALPADRPRPRMQTFRGQREYSPLSNTLMQALQELSRREGATLFMTMLTAYASFLHQLTGQRDLLVGTPIANRGRAEVEPLIGYFVNTLALRVSVNPEATFREVLAQVKQVAIGAYAHQEMPYEQLVQELKPERSLSYSPILQTFFTLDNAHRGADDSVVLGPVTLRPRPVAMDTAKFDMMLGVRQRGSSVRAMLETSADLFEPSTGALMLRQYCALLGTIVSDPDVRVGQLTLSDHVGSSSPPSPGRPDDVDAEMRARLLGDRAGHTAPYPRGETVAGLFEAQAAATANAPAVVSGDATWSYRELNGRANRLARAIQRRVARSGGTPTGTLAIGVCLERSPDTLVALLAILKAGHAYVPLDPGNPAARLADIAERAHLPLIVTRAALVDRLTTAPGARLLIDEERQDIDAESEVFEPPPRDAAALAYVLFTSGTTGTPKAVGVPHRAIVRLVYGLPRVPLGAGQTCLHHSPLAFDASTFEIWGPLLHGGCVAIAPPGVVTADSVESLIATYHVSVLWLTSSLFNAIVDTRASTLRAVRCLLAGGEALSVPHVERALAELPNTRLFNGYGPTEATTFTCCHEIAPSDTSPGRSIPIGRPLLNTRVYVLGTDGDLVADGSPGEL
jgi:amino acid adenylation domain-containing protein